MIMDWFKHDILTMIDTNIQILLSAGGLEYYGFFWCAIESLYQNDGQVSKRGLIAKARSANMSEAAAEKAICVMAEIGLVTVDDQDIIRSERVILALDDFEKSQAALSEHGKMMARAKREKKGAKTAADATGSELPVNYQSTSSSLEANLQTTERQLNKERDIDKEVLKKEVNKKKTFSSSSLSIDALIKQQDINLQDHWKAFVNMRKRIKAPLTVDGLQLSIRDLAKMAATTEERAAIIDQSVQKSWRGLFPLKDTAVSFTPTVPNDWTGTGSGEFKI